MQPAVSAVLHGAPISTFDLDIVPQRDEANMSKLMEVLSQLHAIYRGQFGRVIEPDKSSLAGPGLHPVHFSLSFHAAFWLRLTATRLA